MSPFSTGSNHKINYQTAKRLNNNKLLDLMYHTADRWSETIRKTQVSRINTAPKDTKCAPIKSFWKISVWIVHTKDYNLQAMQWCLSKRVEICVAYCDGIWHEATSMRRGFSRFWEILKWSRALLPHVLITRPNESFSQHPWNILGLHTVLAAEPPIKGVRTMYTLNHSPDL